MKLGFCPGLAVVLLAAGCEWKPSASSAAAPMPVTNAAPVTVKYHLDKAQPKLRTVKVWLGAKELNAEVALMVPEIATGMMFRTNMMDDEGMLFLFAGPDRRGFYMKNCVVPLSAAYIDTNGVVDQIVDLHPGVIEPVESQSDRIKYVLEVPQGWFTRNSVPTGTVVTTSSGMLKSLNGIIK